MLRRYYILGETMAIESNEPQVDAQQHRAHKRTWSAPRVIESELSDTQVSPFSITSPPDRIDFFRFGGAS